MPRATDPSATSASTNSPTLALACDLIARESVTPHDAGCQQLIGERLAQSGFTLEPMRFGEVDNLWARRGQARPLLVFAGHTDVVPTGPLANWSQAPFQPQVIDGYLYGRGAADMKGSIAAFITACERFIAAHPHHQGSIAFLLTSDEEGPAHDGTRRVIDTLEARQEKMDWCLVGEPSSDQQLGDVIKNGRRGSLHGHLRVFGVQGHVAYPHLAENPIHRAVPALVDLSTEVWDQGNAFFPATSFQITNIKAGTGASNVIPGEKEVVFNLRFSTELTADIIKERVIGILDRHQLRYSLQWELSGEPFLTARGALVDAALSAIRQVVGIQAQLSTSGGTSDGRFIAPTGAQVLELGPVNATIHKVNECVLAEDLDKLSLIYEKILENLLGG